MSFSAHFLGLGRMRVAHFLIRMVPAATAAAPLFFSLSVPAATAAAQLFFSLSVPAATAGFRV